MANNSYFTKLPDLLYPSLRNDRTSAYDYQVVKNIFSTENLTVENFTSMFGNLFDMVTAPIGKVFESIKSIFTIDTKKLAKISQETPMLDMLTGVVKDIFDWFKNKVFNFNFDAIKLPEIPDFGELLSNAIRGILKPILAIRLGPLFDMRRELSRFSAGKTIVDFVDKTGDYAPARPANTIIPSGGPGTYEVGRNNTPIVINQSSQSNVGGSSQYITNRPITMHDPFVANVIDSYG